MTTRPEGISETDYDEIEAAVMETVRGRWFLHEYARRLRVGEVQQILDAVGRLEDAVGRGPLLGTEKPPHQRLLSQRAWEIADDLAEIVHDLRDFGVANAVCERIERHARAVQALPGPPRAEVPQTPAPVAIAPPVPAIAYEEPTPATLPPIDPAQKRLAAFAAIDALSIDEKLALFA